MGSKLSWVWSLGREALLRVWGGCLDMYVDMDVCKFFGGSYVHMYLQGA